MQCPYCTAVLPDEDLFCEECGKPLKADAPLCVCGAPEGDLDPDGYCLQCGRRCRPAPEDHIETELSASFAGVADRGLHHPRNEDRCQVLDTGYRQILLVCDGVSSSDQADAAAETASSVLATELGNGSQLEGALARASDAVRQLASTHHETAPSTTIVAAVIEGRQVRIAWLGDSRAYWIAETGSQQLTADHSWLNDVVASGELTYAEAVQSPKAHAITRWIGADAGTEMTPSFSNFHIPGPGWILLCSDGLWNYAPEVSDLAALVFHSTAATALELGRELVRFANEKGGQDNISVALLGFNS